MRLSLLAIGKMKKGPETDLLERYLDRAEKAGKQLGISSVAMIEHSESRAASVELRKGEEAKLLIGAAKPGAFIIALDEHGKDIGSADLAELARGNMENAVPEMAFVIGGPDGHGQEILQSANLVLRMGKMTWPHQLARVMLAEQLYRSITILSGHPYHRV
jgi:23S rRNA (pseudouridine1915-N3)-methyltransferase